MHILSPETDNCPSWISGRGRMTVENISWSISTKECCRPRRGLNPRPPGLQSDGASNWATEAGFYLVWVCTVCQLPFWGSPDSCGLTIPLRRFYINLTIMGLEEPPLTIGFARGYLSALVSLKWTSIRGGPSCPLKDRSFFSLYQISRTTYGLQCVFSQMSFVDA